MLKRIWLVIGFISMHLLVSAQQKAQDVAMADQLRESGKIYVVVACVLLIFIGIVIYLIMLDRKSKKLEKQVHNMQKKQ